MRVHYDDPLSATTIAAGLDRYASTSREVIFVCIGSDRSIGDALGPLVGLMLTEAAVPNVYGTIHNPVHATNLQEKLDLIKQKHLRATIIAVDACLGKSESVGVVEVYPGSLDPGAGVGKSLPKVGDVAVVGVVNVGGFEGYLVLQDTRLSFVYAIARSITAGVLRWLEFSRTQVAAANEKAVDGWTSILNSTNPTETTA